MTQPIPISVFIVTLNEAAHIAEAISSVTGLDEVVVVDSGSTDGTQAIAASLGARVIHQPWLGFAQQKAFALSQCRNEWCLNLDGDEVASPALLKEIQQLVDSDSADMIRLPIDDYFMGALPHRWSRRRSIVRCFKRSLIRYPERRVHENVEGDGRVAGTQHRLLHYGYDDPTIFAGKLLRYAQLRAEDKFAAGKRGSLLKLAAVFPFTLVKTYVFRGLMWSGSRGLVQAVLESMYAFHKEVCLLQLGWQQTQATNDRASKAPSVD